MIPKIIHYCWFGSAPLPPLAERCIASWRRHFPGWEIRRWDESNYDVHVMPYTTEAYDHGKYAFVSDVARFEILHRYGGVYLDTDVEVLRSFDDVLAEGPFMGQETDKVNPGLGMAARAGMPFLNEMLRYYATLHFVNDNGNLIGGTVVTHTTAKLREYGYECRRGKQHIAGFTIYPEKWFNPLDDLTGRMRVGPETHSIHHYAKTWCDNSSPGRVRLSRLAHRLIGISASGRIRRLLKL